MVDQDIYQPSEIMATPAEAMLLQMIQEMQRANLQAEARQVASEKRYEALIAELQGARAKPWDDPTKFRRISLAGRASGRNGARNSSERSSRSRSFVDMYRVSHSLMPSAILAQVYLLRSLSILLRKLPCMVAGGVVLR